MDHKMRRMSRYVLLYEFLESRRSQAVEGEAAAGAGTGQADGQSLGVLFLGGLKYAAERFDWAACLFYDG
eukprot:COSAG01_NODE_68669_length_263_cov_0.945122_1_plen_69_part_10